MLTVKQPQAGILEESIVITGDDSSMHVIAPEGFLLGQDVEVKDSDSGDRLRLMCVFVSSFLTKKWKK